MFLVVGLGNPGLKYEHNRHNIGFCALDCLAQKLYASPWSRKFKGEIAEAKAKAGRILLLKPQTYMNLSGEAVSAAAGFYKIPSERIIVIYDDIDLPPGRLRVKRGGGNGGHNGLKSTDVHIGTAYLRVRIGIGRPIHKDVAGYVLSDFSAEEWEVQKNMLSAIADNFTLLLEEGEGSFMNKIVIATREPVASK